MALQTVVLTTEYSEPVKTKFVVSVISNSPKNPLFIESLMPLASQYLLLVLYNVQAYIKMLFRVTC